MCLHTTVLDPTNHSRMYIAISAAGAFRSDDCGQTWKPINQGLHSEYIPDPKASHAPPETELPDAVASGKEPLLIVGAIAGG